jgi:hypothetical protein
VPSIFSAPRCNRRVSCDASPSNARSESALTANPLDPYNLVGSSKRFTSPATYQFSLVAYYTFDGGLTWGEAPLALPAGEDGISDPAVAFDDLGNAYLMGLLFRNGATPDIYFLDGMAIYRSTDGGRTWSPPSVIHLGDGDDKQVLVSDMTPTSPHFGNVYAAWDYTGVVFARTTNRGLTWKGTTVGGVDQPPGSQLAANALFSSIAVAPDGTVYVFFLTSGLQMDVKYVKSTDGGDTFSALQTAASAITPVPGPLPGGTFRVVSLPMAICGTGNGVMVAWTDYRDGVARIYYARSTNGGNSWPGGSSGQLLTTGTSASAANQHDFFPQLAVTPAGDIGCAFYEFGPKAGSTDPLIDVVLCGSTNNGNSFPDRVILTDGPWDPAVDAPNTHGTATTFIGDYFGLAGSRLGFFPFWTDTRTGVQEIYASRLAVNSADIYIRDSSTDTGTVPSPGNHWESPDLIVRRQADGGSSWVNEDLLRDGVTEHYIYGKVTNPPSSANAARNVRLAVTVGNWPMLAGLPGTEFRFPQDWYPGDWDTLGLQSNRLWLGESPALATVNPGQTRILGPVPWPAGQIPLEGTWHPCLLAEVRADNSDSAGGVGGCDIDADSNPCVYGSYFWGNNNASQRNLSYAPLPVGFSGSIDWSFLLGSPWSSAKFLEVVVERSHELDGVEMKLRIEQVDRRGKPPADPHRGVELLFPERARAIVLVDGRPTGEFVAAAGTLWRPGVDVVDVDEQEHVFGGERGGDGWRLKERRGAVGLRIQPAEQRRATLTFQVPPHLLDGAEPEVRVYQRNAEGVVTGGVFLRVQVGNPKQDDPGKRPRRRDQPRSRGRSQPTRGQSRAG